MMSLQEGCHPQDDFLATQKIEQNHDKYCSEQRTITVPIIVVGHRERRWASSRLSGTGLGLETCLFLHALESPFVLVEAVRRKQEAIPEFGNAVNIYKQLLEIGKPRKRNFIPFLFHHLSVSHLSFLPFTSTPESCLRRRGRKEWEPLKTRDLVSWTSAVLRKYVLHIGPSMSFFDDRTTCRQLLSKVKRGRRPPHL